MAIGWMTILSNVPWSDVIRNAPAVADGAKKLWQKVGRKSAGGESATPVAEGAAPPSLPQLQAQIDELRGQLVASSEIIQALAEQNGQLIARVETTRRRLLWLAAGNVLALGLALLAWLR
jgi:TolA-binding protein